MTVVLSMLTLVPGAMGGSETYARELVRELGSATAMDIATLVAPVARGFAEGLPERVADEYPGGASSAARALALVVGAVRRRSLRRHVADASVLHFPFTVPTPPAGPEQRAVVTLHDVQHHDLPTLFTPAERAYRAWAYDRPARRADAVITVSQFAKDRIVHHLGISPARVHVVHLGVRAADAHPRSRGQEPFLLYPARGWPHKNHDLLIRALPALRAHRPSLRIVLTGTQPHELPPLPPEVEVRGRVSPDELAALYRQASAVVIPSRYEGFGLPAVEAMAAGCPVVASTAGALPEVVGDAGVLFDADDPEALVEAVEQAWDRSDELARLGLRRARRFTWSACAAAHVEVYRDLGG